MAAGVGALESVVQRIKNKLPTKNTKVSVVYTDQDGSLILDEETEYNSGVLAVPLPMTEEEWERTNL